MAAERCAHDELKPSGVECPVCGEAEIVPVRGRFGPMWACAHRPRCAFWMKARPTGRICDHRVKRRVCGALMMEGTKTIPERCSNRSCPNHRPPRVTQKI